MAAARKPATKAAKATRPDDEEDEFLAYWASRDAPAQTRRVLGVDVVVPTDLPMKFERLAERLASSATMEDVQALVSMVFGPDTLEGWIENGATFQQFQVLLMWGIANGQGTPTTFAEAEELHRQAEELAAEGKAPAVVANRADRRASSRTRGSAAAGRSSSRTSAASTASTRTTSRS